jgi:hypothetical protein
MLPPDVFLDTSFALALANPNDVLHERALVLADQMEAGATRLVTTRAVLLEIGNSLAKLRFRNSSIQLLAALENDPHVEIISLNDDVYRSALHLYSNRVDKEWGLTDCVSFVVMQQRNLEAALTHDRHFEQAGYRALLREEAT